MITGCNQDVAYKDKVYHVQTEDRGEKSALVESLIYLGGEIIASRRSSYKDIIEQGYSEEKVAKLLDKQHKRIVVEIRLGKFEQDEPSNFGDGIITPRSLDEVILDYLTSETEGEKLKVEILDQGSFVFGERGVFKVRALSDVTGSPIGGAKVTVKLVEPAGQGKDLYHGVTDPQGICSASFQIPAEGDKAAVVLKVEHDLGSYMAKSLVKRKE